MKSKLKFIIPSAIAILAVIIAAVCISFTPNVSQNIDEMLSTAQKYLVEQNYEQAVIEFNKVIELDPMNAEAYLGLAQTYIDMGNTEKAVETLEKGFELTGDERLKKLLDELLFASESENIVTEDSKVVTEISEKTVSIISTDKTTETISEDENEELSDLPEVSEELLAEKIKSEASGIIAMFDICPRVGEPDSKVFFAQKYNDDYGEDIAICKCIYNSNGYIEQSFSRKYAAKNNSINEIYKKGELLVNDYKNNKSVQYDYTELFESDYSVVTQYYKLIDDTTYGIGYLWVADINYISLSRYTEKNDNCFTYKYPYFDLKINVFVTEENKISRIEIKDGNGYYAEMIQTNGEWISKVDNYGYACNAYPCTNSMPLGFDENDFITPANSDEYTEFFSWNDYNQYKMSLEEKRFNSYIS